jgi:hypothetical protein
MDKTCFKCLRVLPLTDFYAHPRMADGRLNKCRECSRLDSMQNRRKHVDYYRDYDRTRGQQPDRIARRREFVRRQKEEEFHKYRARMTAGNALRDGRLRREPCYFCGSTTDIEMHHPDYGQPLRVYWQCRCCHRKVDGMTKLGVEATTQKTTQNAAQKTARGERQEGDVE